MDNALFALANVLILTAGAGVVGLATRRFHFYAGEFLALSILSGLTFTTLVLFFLSFLSSGWMLILLTTTSILAIAAVGLVRLYRLPRVIPRAVAAHRRGLLLIFLAYVVVTVWTAHSRPLGWDGLFVWNIKARAFLENDGQIPLHYFADPTRVWSHPDYPLMVPLMQLWTYLWIGDAHQSFAKYQMLIFYAAAVPLLFTTAQRLSGRPWHAYVAALLPLAIPLEITGTGSGTSGYADFPIGVFYFASFACLLLAIHSRSPSWLALSGVMAAGVAWTKQEGLILWFTFAVTATAALILKEVVTKEKALMLTWVLLPGAAILIGWRMFLAWSHAQLSADYVPVRMNTFFQNMDRAPEIGAAFLREFTMWSRWSFFWPVLALALLQLYPRQRPLEASVLASAVLLPIPAFAFAYLFSAWQPYTSHVTTSLSRLLLQLSLLGILAIALVVPPLRRRN